MAVQSGDDVLGLSTETVAGPIESVTSPTPGALTLNSPGLVWSYDVTAEGRRVRNVSLGDHGTQVFSDFGGSDGSQRLLSAFDDATPTAVWETARAFHTWGNRVASAGVSPVHVALNYTRASDLAPYDAVVSKYTSSSEIPEWTYTFRATITSNSPLHGDVAVSRDGKMVVAWLYKTGPKETLVAALDVSTGAVISESSIPTSFEPRSSKLSADGSTLLVVTGDRTWIFDVLTSSVIQYYVNWFGVGTGSAISADGTTYAKGLADRQIEVYHRQGSAGYTLMFTPELAANWQCGQAALSDDGTVLACVWANMVNLTDVRVQVYEMHGSTITLALDREYLGVGSFNNIPMDLDMDADGSTIAVGLSGDEGDTVKELAVFRRDEQTGAWSDALAYDFQGTVWDLDLSADGRSLAVASSSNHLDEGAMGGEVSYFALTARDLVLEGVPRAGNTVYLHQYVAPGGDGGLYVGPALANKPTVFPGVGTLQLQRGSLSFTPVLTAGTDGVVSRSIAVPATLVGETTYYQGLEVNPARLSTSWIALTALP